MKVIMWKYFTMVEGSEHFAHCRMCGEQISRGGKMLNITNVKRIYKRNTLQSIVITKRRKLKRCIKNLK